MDNLDLEIGTPVRHKMINRVGKVDDILYRPGLVSVDCDTIYYWSESQIEVISEKEFLVEMLKCPNYHLTREDWDEWFKQGVIL